MLSKEVDKELKDNKLCCSGVRFCHKKQEKSVTHIMYYKHIQQLS